MTIIGTRTTTKALHQLGEHFAAGYMEQPGASPMQRWSRAVRRRFECRSLPSYAGQSLYPAGPVRCGNEDRILSPSYSFTWSYDAAALDQRQASAEGSERQALSLLHADLQDVAAQLDLITTVHTVGGKGYTHSIPNYGRLLSEGLDGYSERITSHLSQATTRGDVDATDFYLGLLDVIVGVRSWHHRLLEQLRHSSCAEPADEHRRQRLIEALERVPCRPASSFFEAVVAYNFCYYLDDCDNPGRVDLELSSYYDRDLARADTTRNDAVDLIRCLWHNCDLNSGWSAGIGGTRPDGETAYSDLTLICLEATRGMRRPNLQLHVRCDMPDQVWDEALETIATGCGLPALYNEEAFTRSLHEADLGIRQQDLFLRNGGGCTETMIHGLSNVGSLDAGIHLPLIFTQSLARHLVDAADFEDLLRRFREDIVTVIDQ
ncbi:MAG: hypothetical protein HOH74_25685, partial [Gemmatimonadetes bacterium]|nr:hypothetical protein [Gemmatimonadota bacterium]